MAEGLFSTPPPDHTWRQHFFEVWANPFKRIVYVLTCFPVAFFIADLADSIELPWWMPCRLWLVRHGYLPEPEVVGKNLASIQSVAPVITSLIMCALLSTRYLNARNFPIIVGLYGISVHVSFGLPAHLAYLLGMGTCPAPTPPPINMGCYTGLNTQMMGVTVEQLLSRAVFHAGCSMLSYMGIAIFLPEPFGAALVMSVMAASNIGRAQYLWQQNYGINLVASTWVFHLSTICVAVAACSLHARLVSEQFRMRTQLQHAKDEHIEQLHREKERLDYERAFAVKRCRSPRPAPDLAYDGCSKLADDERTSEIERTSVLERTSMAEERGGPTPAHAVVTRAALLQHRSDTTSVQSETTCSELGLFGESVATFRDFTESGVTLYRLLPQYYAEQSDKGMVWLATAESRAAYVLQVCEGLLCNTNSKVLGSDGPTTFMFVVDSAGLILVAERQDDPRCNGSGSSTQIHHSSLVAGGPVASAGEIVVDRGKLRAASNWSGHYAPPPSCLSILMDQLAQRGASCLQTVEIETVNMVPSGNGDVPNGRRARSGGVALSGISGPLEGRRGRAPYQEADSAADEHSECSSSDVPPPCWDPALALRSD